MICPPSCNAKCCRKTLTEMLGVKVGIMLLPGEASRLTQLANKFKAKLKIFPMVGYGLKDKARPRPKYVGIYQLVNEPCPFLNKRKNKCKIYKFRPLACRAYPISITSGVIRQLSELVVSYSINYSFEIHCPMTPIILKTLKAMGYETGEIVPEETLRKLNLFNEWIAAKKIGDYKIKMRQKYGNCVWLYND